MSPVIELLIWYFLQAALIPPRQTIQGEVDNLKEGDKGEAHAES